MSNYKSSTSYQLIQPINVDDKPITLIECRMCLFCRGMLLDFFDIFFTFVQNINAYFVFKSILIPLCDQ